MKININNELKIVAAIAACEGKATARTLSYMDIQRAISLAEASLKSAGISKKYWDGCNIYITPESVCNSYKQVPMGTHATITAGKSAWCLTDVKRHFAPRSPNGRRGMGYKLVLSETAMKNRPTTIYF
jgi:hypothetical protein